MNKTCERCGVEIERTTVYGPMPKRCEDCQKIVLNERAAFWNARNKERRYQKKAGRQCKNCQKPLGIKQPTYCSKQCYYIDTFGWRDCVVCGKKFVATWIDHACCGNECAKVKADQTKREQAGQLSDVIKTCARCGSQFRQRIHKTQQIYCEDCLAFKDRDKCRRRRAAARSVAAERINDYEVFERDNWTCKLCNKPIDKSAKWPEAESASIDHIVPLSKGGAHTLNNVQSAHLGCNMVKGNRNENRQTAKADSNQRVGGQSGQTPAE